MASFRVPWVLPIKAGTELFPSTGRVPAVVRVTLGIKPGLNVQQIAALTVAAERIIEQSRGMLYGFYARAAAAHDNGIIPISVKTLNFEGGQARYTQNNGLEYLDITIYPDVAEPPDEKNEPPKSRPWDYLQIDFRWDTDPINDWRTMLASMARFVVPTMKDVYATNASGLKDFSELQTGYMGYAKGIYLIARKQYHITTDTLDGPFKARDLSFITLGPQTLSTVSADHSNTQSYFIDLTKFPDLAPVSIDFRAFWAFSGIEVDRPRDTSLEYRLWKGGHMEVSDEDGPDLNSWTNPTAQAKTKIRQLNGPQLVQIKPGTEEYADYLGQPYGVVAYDGKGECTFKGP